MAEYKRGGTASMIVASVCNEHRNSDLLGGGKPGQCYPAIAYNLRGRDGGAMPEPTDVASVRSASGGSSRTYVGVRRLLPVECEKLQGFEPGHTATRFAASLQKMDRGTRRLGMQWRCR